MLSALRPLFPIAARRKLVGKNCLQFIFFLTLAHYVKHMGFLLASLSVCFV